MIYRKALLYNFELLGLLTLCQLCQLLLLTRDLR
jgi:hypothetical protein